MIKDAEATRLRAQKVIDAFSWLYDMDPWRINVSVGKVNSPNCPDSGANVTVDCDYMTADIVLDYNTCPDPVERSCAFGQLLLHEFAHIILHPYDMVLVAALKGVSSDVGEILKQLDRHAAENAATRLPVTWRRASGCDTFTEFIDAIVTQFENAAT